MLLLSKPLTESKIHLSSTVDKVFTLDGATLCLHRRHMSLLHHNLLDTSSLQDLDSWTEQRKTIRKRMAWERKRSGLSAWVLSHPGHGYQQSFLDKKWNVFKNPQSTWPWFNSTWTKRSGESRGSNKGQHTELEWSQMDIELFAVFIWLVQNKMAIVVSCYSDNAHIE